MIISICVFVFYTFLQLRYFTFLYYHSDYYPKVKEKKKNKRKPSSNLVARRFRPPSVQDGGFQWPGLDSWATCPLWKPPLPAPLLSSPGLTNEHPPTGPSPLFPRSTGMNVHHWDEMNTVFSITHTLSPVLTHLCFLFVFMEFATSSFPLFSCSRSFYFLPWISCFFLFFPQDIANLLWYQAKLPGFPSFSAFPWAVK